MARIKYQEAIGLEVKRGRPPAGPAPSKADLVRLYVKESRSVRDVAIALGCSKDAVHRALKKCGIKARTCAKRSRLRAVALERIEAEVKGKGMKAAAVSLGVSLRTLQYYRAGLRGGRQAEARGINTSGMSSRKSPKIRGKMRAGNIPSIQSPFWHFMGRNGHFLRLFGTFSGECGISGITEKSHFLGACKLLKIRGMQFVSNNTHYVNYS
jgi:hypothetical protein